MRPDLPTGTVTFLFTDVEGSTKLLHEVGAEAYDEALAGHRRALRDAFARHGGVEVDTEGDAFFVAFPRPDGAVAAAAEAQRVLAAGPIRVRMGLHTGAPHLGREGYIGPDVHLGARIAASAHGGQVVLSRQTRSLLDESFELLDLGEHRVKDFDSPAWIYQLGTERFPPLKTISNTNLPRPASSFVGREREVAEIGAMLRDGVRLLTLTGPGGTGKTRLAIESAAEVVPAFRNGVFWVPLAGLRDPALVAATIATTIGANDGLASFIGEREMLLLVDNLEQVVAAAPELASVVEACPNLRVLVTSRERLRVRGETEYAVPPLTDADATTLFCDRTRLEPDDTILELCRRLDDLPLAVELAAARATVLTPAQMLERLSTRLDLLKGGRDAEARQATLRATIEWSHDLLSPDEQALFARLAVFRSGFTLEAAEQVADADLDVLASLVDKSLLRRTDGRFAMLETIREFAVERLEASGEADGVRHRHAGFFMTLAEEAYPNLKGSPKEWLDRLTAEHDNLRAALDRLESAGKMQMALQLAGALYRFWSMRGHLREGQGRLARLLSADTTRTPARARALQGAAALAEGDPDTTLKHAEEARDLWRDLGDAGGVAAAEYVIATALSDRHEWTAALAGFEASLDTARKLGDDHLALLAGDSIAWVWRELGDRERSQTLHEATLALARASGNDVMAAFQLWQLAQFAVQDGDHPDAFAMLREALTMDRELGLPMDVAAVLVVIAESLHAAGALAAAPRLLGAAARIYEEVGGAPTWAMEQLGEVSMALRADLGDAQFEAAWGEGERLGTDEAIELALKAEPPSS